MIFNTALYIFEIISLFIVSKYIRSAIVGISLLLLRSKSIGVSTYILLYLPGTIIHELSHFFTAALLGVRTGDISIFPKKDKDGSRLQLGSVRIEKTDFFRSSLIGAAPFVVGNILLLYLSSITALPKITNPINLFDTLRNNSNLVFWIYIYLIIAISNTLFVSKEDRRHWPVLGAIIFILGIGLFFVNAKLNLPFESTLNSILTPLNSSLLTAITINLIFLSIITIVKILLEKITKKKIINR